MCDNVAARCKIRIDLAQATGDVFVGNAVKSVPANAAGIGRAQAMLRTSICAGSSRRWA
jgi:hypothetical protein